MYNHANKTKRSLYLELFSMYIFEIILNILFTLCHNKNILTNLNISI